MLIEVPPGLCKSVVTTRRIKSTQKNNKIQTKRKRLLQENLAVALLFQASWLFRLDLHPEKKSCTATNDSFILFSSIMSNSALQAYRAALRATRVAFNGDVVVLNSARAKIREGFDANKTLADKEEAHKKVKELEEVAQFLVKNIVQGVKDEDKDRYFLNFHSQTELGSNETIKQRKTDLGSLAGAKVRKCSDN